MMRVYNKPDLTAPRFRKGAKGIPLTSLLNDFKEKYPQYRDVDIETFKKVIATHHGNIWKEVTENREGVDLPCSMGHIVICNYKIKEQRVNVPASIKHGFEILHKNWETDGHEAKIAYSNANSTYFLRNRTLWMFKATREFTRTVAKVYPKNWKKFIITDSPNISKLYKRNIKKHYFKALREKVTTEYNEFDMT